MKNLSFIIILILLSNQASFSQETYLELIIPNKNIEKKSLYLTKSKMEVLKDSLGLSRKATRLKNFHLVLKPAIQKSIYVDGMPAEDFKQDLKDELVYEFTHISYPNKSGYFFIFEYDLEGNLKNTTCDFRLVIH